MSYLQKTDKIMLFKENHSNSYMDILYAVSVHTGFHELRENSAHEVRI